MKAAKDDAINKVNYAITMANKAKLVLNPNENTLKIPLISADRVYTIASSAVNDLQDPKFQSLQEQQQYG